MNLHLFILKGGKRTAITVPAHVAAEFKLVNYQTVPSDKVSELQTRLRDAAISYINRENERVELAVRAGKRNGN